MLLGGLGCPDRVRRGNAPLLRMGDRPVDGDILAHSGLNFRAMAVQISRGLVDPDSDGSNQSDGYDNSISNSDRTGVSSTVGRIHCRSVTTGKGGAFLVDRRGISRQRAPE